MNLRVLTLVVALAGATTAACSHPAAAGRRPVGDDALALTLPSITGRSVDLSTYRGRVVVVNLFSTWCDPCLLQVADLRAVAHSYGDRVQVVGIGMDQEGDEVLRPFRNAFKVDYPILEVTDDIRYGESPLGAITQLPTTIIIGPDGAVKHRFEGIAPPDGLRDQLERLLK